MDSLTRSVSLLTGKPHLEHLYTLKDFPVYMGCTDAPIDDDVKADMIFSICQDTGLIQLDQLLPLDLVYLEQHNDGTGAVWQAHYAAFVYFLEKHTPTKILEIGGAGGIVAKAFTKAHPDASWTIIEPNPTFQGNKEIRVQKGWFDENFTYQDPLDAIVHSHVLEHAYNPVAFIQHIAACLQPGQLHLFSFPNMVKQLASKYTNCLNFEHTVFLAEDFVDYLLKTAGFEIITKEYFQDHSIFYATRRGSQGKSLALPNKYREYHRLFSEFIEYHVDMIAKLNRQIMEFDGDVYLFGAHVFSQYLVAFGLSLSPVKAILDNSPIKIGKRLYGTPLKVVSPTQIVSSPRVGVVLKVGAYREEVLQQLQSIHKDVVIFE